MDSILPYRKRVAANPQDVIGFDLKKLDKVCESERGLIGNVYKIMATSKHPNIKPTDYDVLPDEESYNIVVTWPACTDFDTDELDRILKINRYKVRTVQVCSRKNPDRVLLVANVLNSEEPWTITSSHMMILEELKRKKVGANGTKKRKLETEIL